MNIRTTKGMGIKTTNGMGLSREKNYFKFNEYERKRRYLFGDRGKNSEKKTAKPKPAPKAPPEEPKPVEKKVEEPPPPEPKKEEKEEPEKAKTPEPEPEKKVSFTPPPVSALALAEMQQESGDLPTTRLPPLEAPPKLPGHSVGSMRRMLNLFG